MRDFAGLEYLGKIYMEKGIWSKAYLSFKKYIKWLEDNNLSPSDIYYFYGKCSFELKKYTEAKNAYIKHINFNPSDTNAYIELGLLYEKLGLFKEEEEILVKALSTANRDLRNKTDISSIFDHLAFALFNLKDFIKASGYLAMAAIQFPNSSYLNKITMCEKYWREGNE